MQVPEEHFDPQRFPTASQLRRLVRSPSTPSPERPRRTAAFRRNHVSLLRIARRTSASVTVAVSWSADAIPRSLDETRLTNMDLMAEVLPVDRENAFWAGVENARRFFMGEADVQRALERLARVLDDKGIPYAIVGALALNEWGYRRVTVDVDVLLTPDGLRALKAEVLGLGYVEKSPGSRRLRDTECGVDIDVLL